jgi:hypothetical protein
VASDTQPSAIKIALAGWRDAWRAITQMMSVTGPAFLFTLMSEAAYQLSRGHSFAIDVVVFPVHWIVQSLVLTPLAIAVHRYVLLDEVTEHYALNPADQRFQRFFGLAIALQALWLSIGIWLIIGHFVFGAPMFPGDPVTPEARENLGWIFLVSFAAPFVTCFVIARVILSIAILFPAVATDAPGAGWRNARDDSEGHIGRIFCAFALGFVPVLPLDAVDEFILAPHGSHPAFQTIGVVLRSAKSVLIVSVFASIASTFYAALGRRLNRRAPMA